MNNGRLDYKPHFVVAAHPKVPNSAGITALWKLADAIEAAGHDVTRLNFTAVKPDQYVMSMDGQNWVPVHTHSLTTLLQDIPFPILISGENTDSKYFGNLNFCRYHLNKMGVLLNKGSMKENEYHIAFHKIFYPDCHFHLPQSQERLSLEEARDLKIGARGLDLTYIGKGAMYVPNPKLLRDSVLMTREWPSTNEQYLSLLRNTRVLYSYDSLTAVMFDAMLMGAMPVLLSYLPLGRDDWLSGFGSEFPGYLPNEGLDFDQCLADFPAKRLKFIDEAIELRDGFANNVKLMCEDIIRFFRPT